jgi:serine protease Do
MRLPAALVALLASGCAVAGTDEEAIVQEAKDRVFPAVVFIKPIQEEFRGGTKERVQVFGSGAIISPDGLVVTNNHVAEKATDIRCVLSDKEEVGATVVGLDPETDLALLRLNLAERKNRTPLPVAVFGDSAVVHEGDLVMAMGAPHGFERSVSRGIISSTERYFDFAPYNLFYQTDAAINPGNSGGPLVNIRGQIIGINSRGLRGAENMGFAIPSNVVREIVDALLAESKRPGVKEAKVQRAWTGLRFQALRDFTKSSYIDSTRGVLVAGVDDGSPAEKAGLRAGDIVLACSGKDVQGIYETDLPAIERLFCALPIDRPARLSVARGRDHLELEIVPASKAKQEGEEFECKLWDLTVKEITRFSDPYLHFQQSRGVYVLGVKYGGNAQTSGLQMFDIISKIGDRSIGSLDELKDEYATSTKLDKGKRKLRLRIFRAGYPRHQVLDFEKDTSKIDEE